MPLLYLPAAHTDADVVLASQLAARIDSAELHVAWSADHGQVIPEISAVLRETAAARTDTGALVLGVVRELWLALFNRADRRAASTVPSSRPAVDAPRARPAS